MLNSFDFSEIEKIQAEIGRDLENAVKASEKKKEMLSEPEPENIETPIHHYGVMSSDTTAAPPAPAGFYKETVKTVPETASISVPAKILSSVEIPPWAPIDEPVPAPAPQKQRQKSWGGRYTAAIYLIVAIGMGSLGFGFGTAWGIWGINFPNIGNTPGDTIEIIRPVFEDLGGYPASIAEMLNRLMPSVVSITTTFPNRMINEASGIIFAEDETRIFIVTNWHVVLGGETVTVRIADGPPVQAQPFNRDRYADLSVITVEKSALLEAGIDTIIIATFGDSDQMQVGDTVLAIGNAMGEGNSVTQGIISVSERVMNIQGFSLSVLQTDAALNPGSSGGALINTRGEVIGINTTTGTNMLHQIEGMGYSKSSNAAWAILDRMVNNPYPALGIIYGPTIVPFLAREHGIPNMGVGIDSVIPGSGADIAGIQRRDIITGFGGNTVFDFDDLRDRIRSSQVGEVVEVRIVRIDQNGNLHPITLQVELGSSIVDTF